MAQEPDVERIIAWAHEHLGLTITPEQERVLRDIVHEYSNGNPKRMSTTHPCDLPMPVPAIGEHWQCPDCTAVWFVIDTGWVSGRHWVPVDDD